MFNVPPKVKRSIRCYDLKETGIYYIEEGSQFLYLGIVRDWQNNHNFRTALASNQDQATLAMATDGLSVKFVTPLAQIICEFMEQGGVPI